MKRFIIVLILFAFALAPYAQQKRTTKRPAKKTVTVKSQKSKANSQSMTSVQALEKQRQQIQQQIKEQERRLRNNEQDVKKRLHNLMALNTEIEGKRRTIDTIRKDISSLDIEIEMLLGQFDLLQAKLEKNKKNYVKSMRYMHRNRSTQNQLMFIFSADNLTQMVRRLRFMREYASYQRVQGERVKAEEEEVNRKFQQITNAQQHKRDLLITAEVGTLDGIHDTACIDGTDTVLFPIKRIGSLHACFRVDENDRYTVFFNRCAIILDKQRQQVVSIKGRGP